MSRIEFGSSETQKLAHCQIQWREAAHISDHVSSQGLGHFSCPFSARGGGFSPSRVGVDYYKEVLMVPIGLDFSKVHYKIFKEQCPSCLHSWVGSWSLAGIVLHTSHTSSPDLGTQGRELRNEILVPQNTLQRSFS